jgi:hypothetical protein
VHGEGRRLEAGLLGVGRLEDLDGVLVLLGPADVHPHQHLGEVRGVDATGAGADGDQGLADVVLAREQRADLERLDGLLDLGQLGLGLGQRVGVVELEAELDQGAEVLDPRLQLAEPVDLALQAGEPARDARGVGLVVPQVGSRDLLAEVGDLSPHAVEVEHLADRAHRRSELLDLGVVIGSCHNPQGYRSAPGAPSPEEPLL